MAQYPKYEISAQRLTGIADQARRLGKVSGKLTPGQIQETLTGVGSLSNAEETTFGYVNNVPVERESNYSITSESLNKIAKRTQEMAGTSKLLTPDDIIYWLGRVMFIPQGRSISEFSLVPLVFESAASARLPEVVKAAANSEFSLASLAFESSAVGALSE